MTLRIWKLPVALLLVTSFAAHSIAGEWYQGGTLHRSTAGDWKRATYGNRLATSADFVSKVAKPKPKTMAEVRRKAVELEACITEAVADKTSDGMEIGQIGAACVILLGYGG
jgi:hypothetical protein